MKDIINENIKFKELLLIGPDGEKLGMTDGYKANKIAQDYGLDLVCVSIDPPVCKIIDYGKYKFERDKKAKQKKIEVKTLKISPVIDDHDFLTKVKNARKWLESGNIVNIEMRYRGRMITHQEIGNEIIDRFIENLSDISQVDKKPSLQGNTVHLTIKPKKAK